jgi:hypothetical protein
MKESNSKFSASSFENTYFEHRPIAKKEILRRVSVSISKLVLHF